MKPSDIIAGLSLFISLLAFVVSCYPHITSFKERQRKSQDHYKKLIISSDWTNEGDIFGDYKSIFHIKFHDIPGRTNIYGELTYFHEIHQVSEAVMLRGKIKPNGTIVAQLNLTIGWRESPAAQVTFVYDEDEDLLNYKFNHYVGSIDHAISLSRFDFQTPLWRKTYES